MKLRNLLISPEQYDPLEYEHKGVCFHCLKKVFPDCKGCTFAAAMKEIYDDIDDTLNSMTNG